MSDSLISIKISTEANTRALDEMNMKMNIMIRSLTMFIL